MSPFSGDNRVIIWIFLVYHTTQRSAGIMNFYCSIVNVFVQNKSWYAVLFDIFVTNVQSSYGQILTCYSRY